MMGLGPGCNKRLKAQLKSWQQIQNGAENSTFKFVVKIQSIVYKNDENIYKKRPELDQIKNLIDWWALSKTSGS